MTNIVVLGAGVSGLTTALLLSKNKQYNVTIIAKHMPGDDDIEYASPWAGADYSPVSDAAGSRWERNTWPELARLAESVPAAGIHFQKAVFLARKKDVDSGKSLSPRFLKDPWYKDVVPDYRMLAASELPPDIAYGLTYTTVCINTPLYLAWLAGQCLSNGVVLRRGVLRHISEAAHLHSSSSSGGRADVVVNCTGLLASRLGGVMDASVESVRGQTVLVRNSLPDGNGGGGGGGGNAAIMSISGTDDDASEVSYLMQRAAGGGTILGGTYEPGSWDPQPDPGKAQRIMRRAVELCPALTGGTGGPEALSVVRYNVGLRPVRREGVRVEKERIEGAGGGGEWVVHNYGHGGAGYQSSYGCAEMVVELVGEVLKAKAKL